MKAFTLCSLMLASTLANAAPWYVMPYEDQMSNVSSGQIEARSTDDVAAYVVSCSNPKSDVVSVFDALVIFDKRITSNMIDVRAGKPLDKKPFLFTSAWDITRAEHSSTLSPPDGLHLRDFMLDGGSLEIRFNTSTGPQVVTFDLSDFATAYQKLMHSCK